MGGDLPSRGRRALTDAERADWDAIARTITPLPKRGRTAAPPAPPPSPPPAPRAVRPKAITTPPREPAPAPRVQIIRAVSPLPSVEPKVLRALKREQIALDARLDLHGETQASAHRRLDRFLATARARGQRVVLIVTGKGLAGEGTDGARGILRRMLPVWLDGAPYQDWVMGLSPAGPAHGGSGAFYVVLRRAR